MDIKSLAELGKLADLCRKKGIDSIKITDGVVEFKLSENFEPRSRRKKKGSQQEISTLLNQITDEDLLFWSSGPSLEAGAN